MPIETNLNQSPFFDDYDESKGYQRVLYRPGVPVQARELNQSQSIFQNQIERFGEHVFIDGTIVKGCSFAHDSRYSFVKLMDTTTDELDVNLEEYNNNLVTDTDTGLKATIVNTVAGLQASETGDFNTLYVKYLNVGSKGEVVFANNSVLTIQTPDYSINSVFVESGGSGYSNGDIALFTSNTETAMGAAAYVITKGDGSGEIERLVMTSRGSGYIEEPTVEVMFKSDGTTPSTGYAAKLIARNYIDRVSVPKTEDTELTGSPIGNGYAISVSDGVIYQKGTFVKVNPQTTIISKYTNEPDGVFVGFKTEEMIATNTFDPSLNDNARGFTNDKAPGAYRLKMEPKLVAYTKEQASADNSFFTLIEFENGLAVRERQTSQYSELNKELARRTYEESGNYVVSKFDVYTDDNADDPKKLDAVISSGVGYVAGSRVELTGPIRIPFDKAYTEIEKSNVGISTSLGKYVLVNEYRGVYDLTTPVKAKLLNVAGKSVSTGKFETIKLPGNSTNIIGTVYVRGIDYFSGVVGSFDSTYKLYLLNIELNAGHSFDEVRSIAIDGVAISDIILENNSSGANTAVLKEGSSSTGILPTGDFAITSVVDSNYFVRTDVNNVSIESNGYIQTSISSMYRLPTHGVVSDTDRLEFIVTPQTTITCGTTRGGTASIAKDTTEIIGTTTSFLSDYKIGDYINLEGHIFIIDSILTSSKMITKLPATETVTEVTHNRVFPKNVPISLSSRPSVKGDPVVKIISDQQFSIELNEILENSALCDIALTARIQNGLRYKTLTRNCKVKLSNEYVKNNKTPRYTLGLSNVIKLNSVYLSETKDDYNESRNITDLFDLDTGEREDVYGISAITKRSAIPLGINEENVVVDVDVFENTSGGYFSVDSYPLNVVSGDDVISWEEIPSYTSESGVTYSMRDVIDIRPVAKNISIITKNIDEASIISYDSSDVYDNVVFPASKHLLTCNIKKNLPRYDLIVLNSDDSVEVVQGVPSDNPVYPEQPTNSLILAKMAIPPFPTIPLTRQNSSKPEYTAKLTNSQNKRYTMLDIQKLESKIEQLRYYSLLNSLEQSTQNKNLPSEIEPSMERFKNGFFADPLVDYSYADISNRETKIAIDTESGIATPMFEQHTIPLIVKEKSSTKEYGTVTMLDSKEVTLIEQPRATRYRNPTQLLWSYNGSIYISPSYDNYVSTTTTPVVVDFESSMNELVNSVEDSLNELYEQTKINASSTSSSTSTSSNKNNYWGSGGNKWMSTDTITTTNTTTNTTWDKVNIDFETTSEKKPVGNFLTDSALLPYMRGNPIAFVAYGLRPEAQHYVFFDGVDVNSYCKPAKLKTSYKDGDTVDIKNMSVYGELGDKIVADETGMVVGVFYLPENKFFCGERKLVLTDTNNIKLLDESVSKCSVSYHAYNFEQEKSNVTFLTTDIGGVEKTSTKHSSTTTTSTTTITKGKGVYLDPIAQSFIVSSEICRGLSGILMSGVDLYFKSKDKLMGVTIELRTVELGTPTNVTMASKHLMSKSVNVSDDSSKATHIVFKTPVYLSAEKEYAVVIVPDANNPNYNIWTGAAGEPDVLFPSIISNTDWNQGSMFLSTNSSTWIPYATEDIKMKINFYEQTSLTGRVTVTNGDLEFLTVNNIDGLFIVGEKVSHLNGKYIDISCSNANTESTSISSSKDMTSSLITGDDVVVIGTDDIIIGNYSVTVDGNIITTESELDDIDVDSYVHLRDTCVRRVTKKNGNKLTVDQTVESGSYVMDIIRPIVDLARVERITPTTIGLDNNLRFNSKNSVYIQKTISGVVHHISKDRTKLVLNNSTAKENNIFTKGNVLIGELSNVICYIDSVNDIGISSYDPMVTTTMFPATTISAETTIMDTNYMLRKNPCKMNTNNELTFDGIIRSRSTELSSPVKGKSFEIQYTLSVFNKLSSPAIMTNPMTAICYKYKISKPSDKDDETTTRDTSLAKYISKPIILADGQDSEDLRVYITAHRPTGTQVEVYGKVRSKIDTRDFKQLPWTKMKLISRDSNTSNNPGDFREYEYSFDDQPEAITSNAVVKVTKNSADVETYSDLRKETTKNNVGFEVGDLVVLENQTKLAIVRQIKSITANKITMSGKIPFTYTNCTIKKVTHNTAIYKNYENEGGIVRYYNDAFGIYDGFNLLSIKVVLLSDTYSVVPKLADVRAIACSV